MRVLNVLVFPGGTEIGLEINRALRHCKDIQLFSAGIDVSNHAPYVFARHFIIPSINEAGWINRLNEIIQQQEIDFIYPAYDDVLLALVENSSKINARIVASPLETCRITRSKSKTYLLLASVLPVPKSYANEFEIEQYPVFVKPDAGQGSQHTHIVNDSIELKVALTNTPNALILEYLPGDEFTVDCFSDREAGLLYCRGRKRVRTRSGISMNTKTVDDKVFKEYATKISERLELHGAWFYQVKRSIGGQLKLLEIGPRVAGTMDLHRMYGVNFPLLSIYEQERLPLSILENKFEVELDRALTNRYRHNLKFDAVYVDLDDTLLFKGRVSEELIRALYQWANEAKFLGLISRHNADVFETLAAHRLSNLFDKVVKIGPTESKADYIEHANAIFIDDSFRERKDVSEKLGIPTFDLGTIEMLIDEKA